MSKKGQYKTENEDRILIGKHIVNHGSLITDEDVKLIAIADGVGGNKGGAKASQFVCSRLSEVNLITYDLLKNINDELIQNASREHEYSKMATTLSGICFHDNNASIFHIGNTRISVMQGEYLKQITEDHTTVNWLKKIGNISDDGENLESRKNEIYACMGGGNKQLFNNLFFFENCKSITSAGRIILSSDGIHEFVDINEVENMLCNSDISSVCEKIIAKAEINGSVDDKSIIILDKN